MTPLDLPDLLIPPGEFLGLPKGWSYGELQGDRRVLTHEDGCSILATEMAMDDTIDSYVLTRTLELALERKR